MATFQEWKDRHGVESARRQFGLGEHLVFVVDPGRRVEARCGRWVASEPLASGRNNGPEHAKQRIRTAIASSHTSEQTIYRDLSNTTIDKLSDVLTDLVDNVSDDDMSKSISLAVAVVECMRKARRGLTCVDCIYWIERIGALVDDARNN